MNNQKPTFYLTEFLNTVKNENIESIRVKLVKKGIYTKYYEDYNIMLLYNNYKNVCSNLNKECRSIVIDTITKEIILYTCDSIKIIHEENHRNEYNKNKSLDDKISISYEGSYISLFNHNNKWYFSTRKIIKIDEYIESKHYDMFLEIINKYGYNNVDEFYKTLSPKLSYHYILVHHQNKNVIDYSNIFGEKYMFLYLISIKNKDMKELDINTFEFPYSKNKNFIYQFNDTYDNFEYYNNYIYSPIDYEGIIIKNFDKKTNKHILYKCQTTAYIFNKYCEKSLFIGLLALYQKNKINIHPIYNKNININNYSYTITQIINIAIKCLAREFINLYNNYCDNYNLINMEEYNNLPIYFKIILNKIENMNIKIDMYYKTINIIKHTKIETLIDIINYRHSYKDMKSKNDCLDIIYNELNNIEKIPF